MNIIYSHFFLLFVLSLFDQYKQVPLSYDKNGSDWTEVCKTGTKQSPINITDQTGNYYISNFPQSTYTIATISFNNDTKKLFTQLSDPQSWLLFKFYENIDNVTSNKPIKEYLCNYFELHALAEHQLIIADTLSHYDVEIEFSCKTNDVSQESGKLSLLLDVTTGSTESAFLKPFTEAATKFSSNSSLTQITAKIPFHKNLMNLYLHNSDQLIKLYNYEGSETSPPCSESVNWYVMKLLTTATQAQIDSIKKVFGSNGNARQAQALSGREIKYGQHTKSYLANSSDQCTNENLYYFNKAFMKLDYSICVLDCTKYSLLNSGDGVAKKACIQPQNTSDCGVTLFYLSSSLNRESLALCLDKSKCEYFELIQGSQKCDAPTKAGDCINNTYAKYFLDGALASLSYKLCVNDCTSFNLKNDDANALCKADVLDSIEEAIVSLDSLGNSTTSVTQAIDNIKKFMTNYKKFESNSDIAKKNKLVQTGKVILNKLAELQKKELSATLVNDYISVVNDLISSTWFNTYLQTTKIDLTTISNLFTINSAVAISNDQIDIALSALDKVFTINVKNYQDWKAKQTNSTNNTNNNPSKNQTTTNTTNNTTNTTNTSKIESPRRLRFLADATNATSDEYKEADFSSISTNLKTFLANVHSYYIKNSNTEKFSKSASQFTLSMQKIGQSSLNSSLNDANSKVVPSDSLITLLNKQFGGSGTPAGNSTNTTTNPTTSTSSIVTKEILYKTSNNIFLKNDKKQTFYSQILEYSIYNENGVISVSNLQNPIVLKIPFLDTTTATTKDKLTCYYYNENSTQFESTGLKFEFNQDEKFYQCKTTHLTSFTILNESSTSKKKKNNSLTIGIIIAVVAGSISLIVGGFFLVKCLRKKKNSRKNEYLEPKQR